MSDRPHEDDCTHIFKNGVKPTSQEYTRIWAEMINRIEKQENQG